ncbi:MAG: GNAT family N-acetyltransferase [Aliifodinibius sp.]|nr:GNAT family N-acetyltransferase [Fodinibius sp.]NIV14828.1 GNAT family N-acetyltransferase [Fodinibius sp.]NIY28707.1 GNAT family N-acetyltransferase [Fodinibius sp.]
MQTLSASLESLELRVIDPFAYADWNDSMLTTPRYSIFHTINWLRVLQESYGYQPYYFASFNWNKLVVLLPFMEVKSWITGTRGVSLPFSDYCEPIIEDKDLISELFDQVIATARQLRWKYIEMKGGDELFHSASPWICYYRHVLALNSNEDQIFSRLRSNYRLKIRKALKNDLKIRILGSSEALAEYYRLHCLTRKRHGLPPQPIIFFKKIYEHVISKNLGFVILVSNQGRNFAGAIFFHFGDRAIYKFGASDMSYQHLHPNYLMFWSAIQWLCQNGYRELCFGKTAPNNKGLIQFKDGWGTDKHQIIYYKYEVKTDSLVRNTKKTNESGHFIFKKMPIPLLRIMGSLLYRHVG